MLFDVHEKFGTIHFGFAMVTNDVPETMWEQKKKQVINFQLHPSVYANGMYE